MVFYAYYLFDRDCNMASYRSIKQISKPVNPDQLFSAVSATVLSKYLPGEARPRAIMKISKRARHDKVVTSLLKFFGIVI